jgi:hypothetical protein
MTGSRPIKVNQTGSNLIKPNQGESKLWVLRMWPEIGLDGWKGRAAEGRPSQTG